MAQRSTSDGDVTIEPPRFDRPEVEIRASRRRKKTGTAHWSGSRIVVQIPARLRGRERTIFVDDLVERLSRSVRRTRPATRRWKNGPVCSPRSLQRRRLAELRALGEQPTGALGLVLAGLSRDPGLESAASVSRVGHRRGAGARTGPPQEADHSPRFYEIADRIPARLTVRCSWRATPWDWACASKTGDVDNAGLTSRPVARES
jgi:hypothetical protein